MCRTVKIAPPSAVSIIQRKAPASSFDLAALSATSMVRPLVSMISVMIATLVTPWKGRGQPGVELRRNEYAATQAAKVITSAMINSHIASFLEGMANGRASIGGAVCAPTVKCASLTVPPVVGLKPHPKQQQQIHPKNAHEVPIVGERI